MVQCNFNWFAMSDIVQEEIAGIDRTIVKDVLYRLSEVDSLGLNEKELH